MTESTTQNSDGILKNISCSFTVVLQKIYKLNKNRFFIENMLSFIQSQLNIAYFTYTYDLYKNEIRSAYFIMKQPKFTTVKKLFASTMAIVAAISPALALAQDYDTMIKDKDSAIANLSAEQSVVYAELQNAYNQIENLQAQASELVEGIESDDALLAELQTEIDELSTIIGKRQELLAEQARKVQVTSGSATYLNYVASAKSISDLVGRTDVINRMVESNKELIEVQQADKASVEEKQEVTESTKQEKVLKMDELKALHAQLAEQTANQEAAYNQLTNDINLASEQRNALVAEREYVLAQQRAAQEAAASQATLEASVAAAAHASNPAELEAQYNQALAEAEAQDAAIQAAQAEADQAEVEADQAEAEAAAIREQANQAQAIANETPAEVVTPPVEEPVMVEEPAVVEEQPAEEPLEAEEQPVEDIAEIETVEETTEVPAVEEPAPAPEPELDYSRQVAAQAEADRLAAEAAAAEARAVEARTHAESARANANTLIANAEKYLGTPYVWGGKTPAGFDCSGFVQYVFRETYGIDVGGWTGAQESAGTKISVSEAQPGDLYFWGDHGNTYHVAIATGGGNYIHASQPGTPLEYNSISPYFNPSFAVRVKK